MKKGKKIAYGILWLIVMIILIVTIVYSSRSTRNLVCADVRVVITDSIQERFVRANDIEQWVKRNYPSIFGKSLESINLRKIEDGLRKLHSVEDVAVYTNVFNNEVKSYGALVVRIKQREPIMRINSAGQSYYMDKFGKVVEWSPRYTPRVILVGGSVSAEFARKKLLPIIEFINHDKFWSAQIDQVYVNSVGELSMIPRVGEQVILFGEPDDFQIKFRNLKALYTEGFKNGGWTIYKSISVEYRNQIVCTKK